MHRFALILIALCAVPCAHAQSKAELQRQLTELKQQLDRSQRTVVMQHEQLREERERALQASSGRAANQRDEVTLLRRMVQQHERRVADLQAECARLQTTREQSAKLNDARQGWLERRADAAAARARELVRALCASNAALRDKGGQVPGEAETLRTLAQPIGFEITEDRGLVGVLNELGDALGLQVAVLSEAAERTRVSPLSLRDVPAHDVLDRIARASSGQVRWRVEGRCLVVDAR